MLIELSITWIIVLNTVAWLVIQIGLAWSFTKMPAAWFKPRDPFDWEDGGRFYKRVFRLKSWKDRLPDGARWFGGGFAKSALARKQGEYFQRFIRETWRGELCHWAAIACAPVFFLWNPWWGDVIIVAYALAANLPCILVQRYNRARLLRVFPRRS